MDASRPENEAAPDLDHGTDHPPPGRIVGVDLARGIAVLGMLAAHVGPDPAEGGPASLLEPVHGRSAALFAVLAGVSIALLSGGHAPPTGPRFRRAAVRIAVRAAVLFALGVVLTALGTPVLVILDYYALYFLFAIPFLRLRTPALAAVAALTAIAGPLASQALRGVIAPTTTPGDVVDLDPLSLFSLRGLGDNALALLLTGAYPVLTWLPFIFAGMAAGRAGLRSPAVRRWLLWLGPALAVVGYGGSWLVLDVFGGADRLARAVRGIAGAYGRTPAEFLRAFHGFYFGTVPTSDPSWELVSAPHSGTPFEVIGATGTALFVLGGCLFLAEHARQAVAPLAAVGALALTTYVLQLLAIWLLWGSRIDQGAMPLVLFIVVSLGYAAWWYRWVGRGPMERMLSSVSLAAANRMR